jgi:1-deoxy-D-xylulose-5-phosphate reductoisomerase
LYDSDRMNEKSSLRVKVAVLGSTGSIGKQTLDIARSLPDEFQIVGLAAGENLSLLARQIEEFKPQLVCCQGLSRKSTGQPYELTSLDEMAAHPGVDIVVIATSGKSGLSPLLAAIRAEKKIALANKEPLVMAGEIVLEAMKKRSGWILPVDSEHSAIWQCMAGETTKPARIILTASGGPFRGRTPFSLQGVTAAEALKHPSWKMGKKVSIDSATLMNKGLEVIEAHWLFDMSFDQIAILIHPQSIVHSMVELADGSIKAQLSSPDMRLPIQYALSYPKRFPNSTLPKLDWSKVNQLQFEPPDMAFYPCLKLAIEAGRKGGTYPAALCGADDAAVEMFLAKKIAFTGISQIVDRVLEKHNSTSHPNLEQILAADQWARVEARESVSGVN